MKDKISDLVSKLQSQSYLPLWSLNNEMVIYSIAVNSKPAWGKKTKLLNSMITVGNKLWISDFILFSVGLFRAVSLWLKTKRKEKNYNTNQWFNRIFFSFKVSSEDYFYSNYVKTQNRVLKIDSFSLEGSQYFGRPPFWIILNSLFHHAFGFTTKLKLLQSELNLNIKDFLTVGALNIGTYAFYRSFWQMLKSKNIEEVAFITLDIPLHACIDEGIKTIYYQHGLLSRSLLIPKVNHFYALTEDEESYLKQMNSQVNIKTNRTYLNHKMDKTKNNNILILSPNIFLEDLPVMLAFICQIIFKELKMVIRPTPHVSEKEMQVLLKEFPQTSLDDITMPLHTSIEKWNPKIIVAGWMSTGLATALEYECLPICLNNPNAEDKWMKRNYPNDYWNTIYPIKSRILFWPRDHEIIANAMTSQNVYQELIKKLKG